MYNAPYEGVANNLAQYGRFGDSQLVHMNPIEVQMLGSLSPTGQLTINPVTGQPEAFLPFLAPLLGSFLGKAFLPTLIPALTGKAALAGAIGSGLAQTAATGDLKEGIMAGITGYGMGKVLQAGTAASDAAKLATTTPPVTEAATSVLNPQTALDQLQTNLQQAGTIGVPTGMAPPTGIPDLTQVTPAPPPAFDFSAAGQELMKPGTFLPIYTGTSASEAMRQQEELDRIMREQGLSEEEAKRKYEADAQRAISTAMRDYPQLRPRGMAAGGRVEGYQMGGRFADLSGFNPMAGGFYDPSGFGGMSGGYNTPFGQTFPADIQSSLRGPISVAAPYASYSALDVGGRGYTPGIAPEFQYFRRPDEIYPTTYGGGMPGGKGGSPVRGGGGFGGGFGGMPGGGMPGGKGGGFGGAGGFQGGGFGGMGGFQGGGFGGMGGGFGGTYQPSSSLSNMFQQQQAGRGSAQRGLPGGQPTGGQTPGMQLPGGQMFTPSRFEDSYNRFLQSQQPFNQPVMGYDTYGQIFAQPQRPPAPSFGGKGGSMPSQPTTGQPPSLGGKGGSAPSQPERPPQTQPDTQPDISSDGMVYAGGTPGFYNQTDEQMRDRYERSLTQQPPPGQGRSLTLDEQMDKIRRDYEAGSVSQPQLIDGGGAGRMLDFPSQFGKGPELGGMRQLGLMQAQQQAALMANANQNRPPPGMMLNPNFDPAKAMQTDVSSDLSRQQYIPMQGGAVQAPIMGQVVDMPTGKMAIPREPIPQAGAGAFGQPVEGVRGEIPKTRTRIPFNQQMISALPFMPESGGFRNMGSLAFQEGGEIPNSAENMEMMMAETMPQGEMAGEYDRLIQMTMQAVLGQVENPDEIIQIFIDEFGVDAFRQLRDAVLNQQVPGAQTEGMVNGNGGGMDDQVMGMIGNQRPVAVSPGEYIVPADVVSGLGDGSSQGGADILDELSQAVRMTRTGTTEQPRPLMETVR